jgi:hypothetical protein
LGQLLSSLEEGVREDDVLDVSHERILCVGGIDVEKDGHIYLLIAAQPLLLEAEALNFIEVQSCGNKVISGRRGR